MRQCRVTPLSPGFMHRESHITNPAAPSKENANKGVVEVRVAQIRPAQ